MKKMTRKRFVKKAMGKGASRNNAQDYCRAWMMLDDMRLHSKPTRHYTDRVRLMEGRILAKFFQDSLRSMVVEKFEAYLGQEGEAAK